MLLGYMRSCNIWSDVTGFPTHRHPIILQTIWEIGTENTITDRIWIGIRNILGSDPLLKVALQG